MKHIIFDFDGTLADSLPLVIDIAQDMLGITINKADIEQYRNLTALQVLKIAKIPLWRLPSLLVKGRAIMAKRTDEIQIFEGLDVIIKDLATEDRKLYVLSSNGAGIITRFLIDNGIRSYFSAVYGNVGLFSKAQAIKKVMKREGFNVEDTIYVGDEVRDIEAAKKVGLPIISVTWGYNGKKILKQYKPDYLVDTPAKIDEIVNG